MSAASFAGLPELLAEIAEVAGLEAAFKLAEAKGGQRVYIPAHPLASNWLTEAVGFEAARKICDHFRTFDPDGQAHSGHSRYVIVPLGPNRSVMKQARAALERNLAAGLSVREAARRAGLHERTGFKAKKRLRETGERAIQEPTLFDALDAPLKPLHRRRRG